MDGPVAVRLRGVGVRRDGRWILRGVNLDVSADSTCAVVGPNGSGKSTLLRVIEGYEFPTEGQVWVLGRKLGETDVAELRKRVRLVGGAGGTLDFAPAMSLLEVVATGGRGHLVMYDQPSPAEARSARSLLRGVGLRGELRWGVSSAGERLRALLARARMPIPPTKPAANPARLILLDEPTAHLDLVAREQVVAAMAHPSPRVTQLIVTHHVEELPAATTTALLLSRGKPVACGPALKVLTSRYMSAAFASPVWVRRTPTASGGVRWAAGPDHTKRPCRE